MASSIGTISAHNNGDYPRLRVLFPGRPHTANFPAANLHSADLSRESSVFLFRICKGKKVKLSRRPTGVWEVEVPLIFYRSGMGGRVLFAVRKYMLWLSSAICKKQHIAIVSDFLSIVLCFITFYILTLPLVCISCYLPFCVDVTNVYRAYSLICSKTERRGCLNTIKCNNVFFESRHNTTINL